MCHRHHRHQQKRWNTTTFTITTTAATTTPERRHWVSILVRRNTECGKQNKTKTRGVTEQLTHKPNNQRANEPNNGTHDDNQANGPTHTTNQSTTQPTRQTTNPPSKETTNQTNDNENRSNRTIPPAEHTTTHQPPSRPQPPTPLLLSPHPLPCTGPSAPARPPTVQTPPVQTVASRLHPHPRRPHFHSLPSLARAAVPPPPLRSLPPNAWHRRCCSRANADPTTHCP